MSFTNAVKSCFSKYFTFSGRSSRPEYWWFFLFCLLGSVVTAILDRTLFGTDNIQTVTTDTSAMVRATNSGPLGTVFSLAILLPTLTVGWRRMHDTGRSGLYLFYPLICMIGIGMFLAVFGNFGGQEAGSLSAPIAIITMLAMIVLALSPLIVLWWLTRPSQPGPNEYGPNPHEVPQ